MSLVNDALKRAKDAHDKQAAPPLRGAPLHTYAPAPSSGNSRRFWLLLFFLCLMVGGLAVVGSRVWYFLNERAPTIAEVAPTPVVSTPPAPAVIEPQPIAPTPPPVAPPPPVPAPAVIPTPVVVIEEKPAPPEPPPNPTAALKLQGILYSATKPAAILNGRTVYVGDNIAGMTISAIAPDHVTVLHNKQPFVLRMP